jgi:hypothetical protein
MVWICLWACDQEWGIPPRALWHWAAASHKYSEFKVVVATREATSWHVKLVLDTRWSYANEILHPGMTNWLLSGAEWKRAKKGIKINTNTTFQINLVMNKTPYTFSKRNSKKIIKQ